MSFVVKYSAMELRAAANDAAKHHNIAAVQKWLDEVLSKCRKVASTPQSDPDLGMSLNEIELPEAVKDHLVEVVEALEAAGYRVWCHYDLNGRESPHHDGKPDAMTTHIDIMWYD